MTAPAPSASAFALTGVCACCGDPTGSLFAMGHDARFRSRLTQTLVSAGWDGLLTWHSAAGQRPVSVREALEAVASTLGRDWTEKVERAASRLARTPVSGRRPAIALSEPSSDPLSPRPVPAVTGGFEPRDFARERVDALLDRLSNVPLTGQWGWWRPTAELAPRLAGTDSNQRFPARVQCTHRTEGSSLIDLFCPQAFKAGLTDALVAVGCDPTTWLRDDDARTG